MSLINISNAVLEHFTGLPSKDSFLKKCVVPAKDDDKFNNNRCVRCWGEYTKDHPGVKISPCGHVFGRDCLKDVVDGPTGDLCPYCRVKLFRRMPTTQDILGVLIFVVLSAYCDMVLRLNMKMKAFVSIVLIEYPILRPIVFFAFGGLALPAEQFVRNYTGVCARNPAFNVRKFFGSTTLLTVLLMVGVPFIAPAFLPVYFLFGTKAFKASWAVANLAYIMASQAAISGYLAPAPVAEGLLAGGFNDESDCVLLTIIAGIAIIFQQLCISALLWPASTLGFAWTVLASIMWR
ncbi:hypothetical protein N0V87_003697 [Didymella glomerata]|jgi:hypothetical protein|uniref:RING-type domain-containing protein n=1 Tax=Didymella glomerata TaxID=749621 RepID=A0A9W8X1P5_9PLEO|nr:hypothetical protein N0V87_003697 [Didymella glomerata]